MSNRRKRRPAQLARATAALGSVALAADHGSRLVIAAPGEQTVDEDARTISGLVVPFGPAGETSGGRLKFSAGSLAISEAKRVKLLREHDQRDVVGFGLSFEETPAGLVGTFSVPEGDNGDRALAEARNGLRDAFSVGVQLDDATMQRLQRARGGAVDARGMLREVSQVSVPAFDDARVAAAAGADLVVSAWSTTTTTTTSAAGAGTTTTEGSPAMTEEQRRRLAALRAQDTLTQAEAAELSQLGTLELAEGTSTGTTTAAGTTVTGQPGTATAGTTGPAVLPAVAGAAVTTAEPSTYDFSGSGHSLVVDLYRSRMDADSEAAQRVERFNAELREGNPASHHAFITAAATRDNVDGAGTDLPSMFQPNPNRPDLMRQLVDVKRPLISRLDRVPITNAQPFAIPKVGEFDGVGAHTEGTPHRAAGTLSLSGDTVQPTATSGAYEVSRELVDAMNPAIDRVAARAMLRDYQRDSEGKVVALLAARAAQADALANAYGVDGVLALRGAMLDFVNDDEETADIVAVSKSLLKRLGLDVDTTERPQLPFVGPVNAAGGMKAGYTGVAIDGVEVFRAARLDAGVGVDTGVLARSEGILWCESNVLQFRFDEVLGPGVVKLALWAYSGAALLDTADVQIINAGADPTP